MTSQLDLAAFLATAPRGTGADIARRMGVHPVMLSQWASKTKPVPEERAPALEYETGFKVVCEVSCPKTVWQRVADPGWPNGKPLIDKASGFEMRDVPEPAKAT